MHARQNMFWHFSLKTLREDAHRAKYVLAFSFKNMPLRENADTAKDFYNVLILQKKSVTSQQKLKKNKILKIWVNVLLKYLIALFY